MERLDLLGPLERSGRKDRLERLDRLDPWEQSDLKDRLDRLEQSALKDLRAFRELRAQQGRWGQPDRKERWE